MQTIIKWMTMRNKLILFPIFSLILFATELKAEGSKIKDSIVVTYIANAGFLIEIDDFKVVIDGFFNQGLNRFEIPDSVALNKLSQNESPFHDLDLILVTHSHADHFNDSLVFTHMINNKKAVLVCPNQVNMIMKKDSFSYSLIKNRIRIITPDTDSFIKANIDSVELITCRLWHGKKQNKNIENVAFILTYKNKTIFHSGDATIQDFNGIIGLDFPKKEIDIAFLFSGFGGIPFLEKTDSLIRADNYVFMHLSSEIVDMFFEPFISNADLIKNPFVFRKKMERKIFYLTDY